jgi:hypothetical protein
VVNGRASAAIAVSRRDTAVVIRVPPSLDTPGLTFFQHTLRALIADEDDPFVIVEITAALPIDVSILDVLVEGASQLNGKRGRIVVKTPTHHWSYPP